MNSLIDIATAKRLTLYERHMWGEILNWEQENKEGLWNYCTTVSTNAIKSVIKRSGTVVPPSFSDKMKSAIETALRTCLSASLLTTNKNQVIEKANQVFATNHEEISQLKQLELEQLDQLAISYSTTNQILAVLEGAGMGLGGIMFIAADIPALMVISLRILIQLAYIYGIDASDPRERQYILNVMTLASAEQKERHDIFCRLDQEAKINAQMAITAIQIEENVIDEVMKRAVGAAHRIALRLSHAKLLQLLPLIGLAIGAGANFAYTREITAYGMMMFRKRWLMEKYSMFEDVLRFRESKNEKLLASWVIIQDDGDDIEFEEDFQAEPESFSITDENQERPSSPLYPTLIDNTTHGDVYANANYYKALLHSNSRSYTNSPASKS